MPRASELNPATIAAYRQAFGIDAIAAIATSGLTFVGTWNANGAAPTPTANGQYWIVSVAGTTNLGGINSWGVGDWAIFKGAGVWVKAPNPAEGLAQELENDLASTAAGKGAALVGFKQSGTGAVPRTMQNKLADGWVSVLDFIPTAEHAAIRSGSSSFDCAGYIQAAIDYCVYVSRKKLYFPSGKYTIGTTLHAGYDGFKSCHIEGEGKCYSGETSFVGTLIAPTFSNAPAIAVQGARGTIIRSMSFKGLNYTWIQSNNLGDYAGGALDDLDAANWVDPALHPNAASRYAPYCAIAIDPYSGVRPAVSYPDVAYNTAYTTNTQYGRAASSEVLIEDVNITGFVAAVAIKPSDADGNADFVRLRNCYINCCVYGISVGHTQSRIVDILNTNGAQIHTFLTTKVHGRRTGRGSFRISGSEPGNCVQLLDVDSGLGGPMMLEFVYAESIYRIGNYSSNGENACASIEFVSCEFSFGLQNRLGAPKSVLDVNSTPCALRGVVLTNGFGVYHIIGSPKLDGVTTQFSSESDLDESVPLYVASALNATCGITLSTQANRTFAKSTCNIKFTQAKSLTTGAASGSIVASEIVLGRPSQNIPLHSQYVAPDGSLERLIPTKLGASTFTASASELTLSQSGREVTLTFNSPPAGGDEGYNAFGFNPGDLVIHDASNTVFFIRARTAAQLTLVAQNNITAANVLRETIAGGNFYFFVCRFFTMNYETLATMTSGSATLTNVGRDDGYGGYTPSNLQVGDAFHVYQHSNRWIGFHTITAIDGTAKTITLSSSASKSGVNAIGMMIRKAPANV